MRFLSTAWAEAANAVATELAAEQSDMRFSVRHHVRDTPEGDVEFTARVAAGRVTVSLEDDGDADVVFTADYATAVAIHRGELSPQEAIRNGLLTVQGNTDALLRQASAFATLGEALAGLRDQTTY